MFRGTYVVVVVVVVVVAIVVFLKIVFYRDVCFLVLSVGPSSSPDLTMAYLKLLARVTSFFGHCSGILVVTCSLYLYLFPCGCGLKILGILVVYNHICCQVRSAFHRAPQLSLVNHHAVLYLSFALVTPISGGTACRALSECTTGVA